MDQLGNTEPTTEKQGSDDRPAEGSAGETDAPCAAVSLAVYRVDLAAGAGSAGSAPKDDADAPDTGAADNRAPGPGAPAEDDVYPDGFTGFLALQNVDSFDAPTVSEALSRITHLLSWTQAQQSRLLHRMETIFRDELVTTSGQPEPGMAFSLAASECATILNIPQTTGQALMLEAGKLCGTHAATLTGLEEGRLSYRHAQVVLEQCRNIPDAVLPEFEADLLQAAAGKTPAQFAAKARRLRENRYPDTVAARHLTAFDKRRVVLDREEDGMSRLSAYLRAEEAQQIYTTLSTAARGEQADGDSRSTDQLRADILAQLLMGGLDPTLAGAGAGAGGSNGDVRKDADSGEAGIVPRAEIMVLINAETLFGADNQPAELHGYGPISAEAARRLARNATGWTGLARNPDTGEILGVGRRRKVPAGLRRWLRARDGTCRFPGCRVSTATSDIDHTIDWAQGGPTDHGNLEHLCRRHHRYKTLGYWKARQPEPGAIEWTSPAGRIYRTEPFLELGHPRPEPPGLAPNPNPGQTPKIHNHPDPLSREDRSETPPPF